MKNIVRYLRRSQEFDLTQSELASKIGVTKATISSIERGGSTSVENALKISKVFSKDVKDIFFTDL
ncbi:helix-turn-helix transcriptional regulator [Paenibacillus aquistagni]|uniref:helix-turn-helix transcriptional regulator n=1 Tax=Paenibacillus aquistagni TaxID=1852522 RepID=UPI00145BE573|nr:helix-turn-helix transcriptional regulator [Paenibacillus aquistagni]NMM52036.1 helix-turn-helix transcriptional regulator [Paenibacillus aquistagni]